MNNGTMIKISVNDCSVSFRTISRKMKSPHRFYISVDNLRQLETQAAIIVQDIGSFAVLRKDMREDTLEIRFTWLSGNDDSLSGYTETVVLPYSGLTSFVWESLMCGRTTEWNVLSTDLSEGKPKLVFKAGETLYAVVSNGVLRRKLARALRDNFNWPKSDEIHFHADFLPYSFIFEEIWAGQSGLVGGLILHGQDDMRKAYYSVHT